VTLGFVGDSPTPLSGPERHPTFPNVASVTPRYAASLLSRRARRQ